MNLLQVKGFLLFFCGVLTTAQGVRVGSQPNPPSWPQSVAVFDPSDDAGTIMGRVMAAFETNGGHDPPNHGQFSIIWMVPHTGMCFGMSFVCAYDKVGSAHPWRVQ